jgi:hypothetical protein
MPQLEQQTHWKSLRGISIYMRVSPTYVRETLLPAGLPHVRLGARYRFDPVQVDAWLNAHPGQSLNEVMDRLDAEWEAAGGRMDAKTVEKVADALRPSHRRTVERAHGAAS